jgi:hypothetical protein
VYDDMKKSFGGYGPWLPMLWSLIAQF